MKKEVTQEDIFQAIMDLSTELKETRLELKEDIAKVDRKVDKVNRKFAVFQDELITVKADIRELQSVNDLL